MSGAAILLELDNVGKRFDAVEDGDGLDVLCGVTLQVPAGESLAVVGPSGSGKSTLLNVIGGLDRPTTGRVSIGGNDLARLDDAELARVRNRDIGFVFQLHHLLPQCTALENVLVPTLVDRVSAEARASRVKRARQLLERVGLADRASHRPGQLSGGERQRVAVVRAMINGPKLLLADEPTGALDRAASDQLTQLLVELNREEGVALMVVTHSRQVASQMGRVFELRDGTFAARESRP